MTAQIVVRRPARVRITAGARARSARQLLRGARLAAERGQCDLAHALLIAASSEVSRAALVSAKQRRRAQERGRKGGHGCGPLVAREAENTAKATLAVEQSCRRRRALEHEMDEG